MIQSIRQLLGPPNYVYNRVADADVTLMLEIHNNYWLN